jgi:ADP-ribose pyrophosphatase YjhB (NUDIX family)
VGYVEELRALVGHRPLIFVAGVALIFDEQDRLLLIRRADTHEWAVVGGLMEPGEAIEDTARREVAEEIGLDLPDLRFVGVLSGPDIHMIYPNGDEVYSLSVVYAGRYTGQELRLDPSEVEDVSFFPRDALPSPLRKTTGMYLKLHDDSTVGR